MGRCHPNSHRATHSHYLNHCASETDITAASIRDDFVISVRPGATTHPVRVIECALRLQPDDKLRRRPRIIITADSHCAIKRSRGTDTTHKQILVRNIAAIL